MKLKSIALIIPDFDFGGEETRVVNFVNYYSEYFEEVYLIAPEGKSHCLINEQVICFKINVRNLFNIQKVLFYLKKRKIQVFQGHKRMTLPYLKAAENILNIKSFFNFDNIYLSGNNLFNKISPRNIVYLSDVLKNFYQPYYIGYSNTTIEMGGTFFERYSAAEKKKYRSEYSLGNKFVILSLGRLTEQKNHKLLIESLSLFPKKEMIHCLIAGSGPLESQLRDLVIRKGLNKIVSFLGHRTDIENLLNISDVLIQTSIFEGFPNVFIEAASVGLPIISTNVGSAKTLVQNNGILIEEITPIAINRNIINLVTDYSKYKDAAQLMANSEYFKRFSRTRMLENYVSYITNL